LDAKDSARKIKDYKQ